MSILRGLQTRTVAAGTGYDPQYLPKEGVEFLPQVRGNQVKIKAEKLQYMRTSLRMLYHQQVLKYLDNMVFAFTLEVSEAILKKGISDYIHEMSDYISAFLKNKTYGRDLETFYIGVICVSSEFDFFFKVRKPRYSKKNIIIQDDRPYELINYLTYDIKLDYEKILSASENEVKKMLSKELLNSFTAFNSVKIKAFDRKGFENDIAQQLNQYIQELSCN